MNNFNEVYLFRCLILRALELETIKIIILVSNPDALVQLLSVHFVFSVFDDAYSK